ncbi:hypothetical protein FPOA_11285 [Fusarium poae]|uniref:Uncharacterized protein n=1 Tax=Fusarium poae TaxID=36050 RepID=A0A1B8AGG9_FUSPO|nr:hypothetical protein FPOA_11285 [Fusarium poae]
MLDVARKKPVTSIKQTASEGIFHGTPRNTNKATKNNCMNRPDKSDSMALKVGPKASSAGGSVQRKETPESGGQSCYRAVCQIPPIGQFHATPRMVFSTARSLEASSRARCRRRQLYHQQKPDCGPSQVTKVDTPNCHVVQHKQTRGDLRYVYREHDQARDWDPSAKKNGTDPSFERIKYVYKSTDDTVEPLRIEDLEDKIGRLTIALEDRPLRAVSPGVEEAYMRGEPLTPPEIEFSEYSEEDDYWAWDQNTQLFRHWDEDLGEWVSFPERFD